MDMKKIILIVTAFLFVFGSCTKDDDKKSVQTHVYPKYVNSHRATKIKGKNDVWGEFELLLRYSNHLFSGAVRRNNEGDTVGSIMVSRDRITNIDEFVVNEKVYAISPDSIHRMDIELEKIYGKGNYSLEDSIPKSAQPIYISRASKYEDGRIYKQVYEYYEPRQDVGVTGVDFNNSFILTKRATSLYEYNLHGRIVKNRIYEDTFYDRKEPLLFTRVIYKYETTYESNKIVGLSHYVAYAGENYSEMESYRYNYQDNRLVSVVGNKSFYKEIRYSGKNIAEVIEGEKHLKYLFTQPDYPSRIEDSAGNFMEVEYEVGDGDFSNLIPLSERQSGNPYIK